jgi:hypothetical protein
VTWVGRERRFSRVDVEAMKVSNTIDDVRLEGLNVRVSGSLGRESSLTAQERRAAGHLHWQGREGVPGPVLRPG